MIGDWCRGVVRKVCGDDGGEPSLSIGVENDTLVEAIERLPLSNGTHVTYLSFRTVGLSMVTTGLPTPKRDIMAYGCDEETESSRRRNDCQSRWTAEFSFGGSAVLDDFVTGLAPREVRRIRGANGTCHGTRFVSD